MQFELNVFTAGSNEHNFCIKKYDEHYVMKAVELDEILEILENPQRLENLKEECKYSNPKYPLILTVVEKDPTEKLKGELTHYLNFTIKDELDETGKLIEVSVSKNKKGEKFFKVNSKEDITCENIVLELQNSILDILLSLTDEKKRS